MFCRDLADDGFSYADAVAYWEREGQPDRMDADLNGVPCETVYAAGEVAGYWEDAGARDPMASDAVPSSPAEDVAPLDDRDRLLAGQWYNQPSYGGGKTYSILAVDADGVRRGERAYWPRDVAGDNPAQPGVPLPLTGGNEYPFAWELAGETVTLRFHSGRVEHLRIDAVDATAHELLVTHLSDGGEQRTWIGCRSPHWSLPGATAPGC